MVDIYDIIGLMLAIVNPIWGFYGYIASIAFAVFVIAVKLAKKKNKPSWPTVYDFLVKLKRFLFKR